MQIGCVGLLLALFWFVLSFYGESLGGCGFVMVLPTIVIQALSDKAHGELPADTQSLISY